MRNSGNYFLDEEVVSPHEKHGYKVILNDLTWSGLKPAIKTISHARVCAPYDGYAHTLEDEAEEELVGEEEERGEEEEGAVKGEGGSIGGKEGVEHSQG